MVDPVGITVNSAICKKKKYQHNILYINKLRIGSLIFRVLNIHIIGIIIIYKTNFNTRRRHQCSDHHGCYIFRF